MSKPTLKPTIAVGPQTPKTPLQSSEMASTTPRASTPPVFHHYTLDELRAAEEDSSSSEWSPAVSAKRLDLPAMRPPTASRGRSSVASSRSTVPDEEGYQAPTRDNLDELMEEAEDAEEDEEIKEEKEKEKNNVVEDNEKTGELGAASPPSLGDSPAVVQSEPLADLPQFSPAQQEAILSWVRAHLTLCPEVTVTSFAPEQWKSGVVFCALVALWRPKLIDMDEVKRGTSLANLQLAFDLAEEELSFVSFLNEEETDKWQANEILFYVLQFYQLEKTNPPAARASREGRRVLGDPANTFFHAPLTFNGAALTPAEAKEATAAYKRRFTEVINALPNSARVSDEALAVRPVKARELEINQPFRPLPETDPRGGYFSETMRKRWQMETEVALERCRTEIARLKQPAAATEREGQSRGCTNAEREKEKERLRTRRLAALEAQEAGLQQYLNMVLGFAGARKHLDGTFSYATDDTAVATRAQAVAKKPAASMRKDSMGGIKSRCAVCDKAVYRMEGMEIDGTTYHRLCFRCTECNRTLKKEDYGTFDDKLFCGMHLREKIAKSKVPRHPYGDPLNVHFKLAPRSDPSGVMWNWEIQAARQSYSRWYNKCLSEMVSSVTTAERDTGRMARRDAQISDLEERQRWRPIPEIFVEGRYYSRDDLQRWLTNNERDLLEAQTRIETIKADMRAFPSRREAIEALRAAELQLTNCREYRRVLYKMSGRDYDAVLKEEETQRANREAAERARLKDVCGACGLIVYQAEKTTTPFDKRVFHRICLRCAVCSSSLRGKQLYNGADGSLRCDRHIHTVRATPPDPATPSVGADLAPETASLDSRDSAPHAPLTSQGSQSSSVGGLAGRPFDSPSSVRTEGNPLQRPAATTAPQRAVAQSLPDSSRQRSGVIGRTGIVVPTPMRHLNPSLVSALAQVSAPPHRRASGASDRTASSVGTWSVPSPTTSRAFVAPPSAHFPLDPGKPAVADALKTGGAVAALTPPVNSVKGAATLPKRAPSPCSPSVATSQASSKGFQWAKTSFGIDRDTRMKIQAKYDVKLERRIRRWIEAHLESALPREASLEQALKDGQVLCRLINAIAPDSVRKVHASGLAFKQMENIQNFLTACGGLGVAPVDLFMTVDLFEGQNMNQVLSTLKALDRAACLTCPGYSPQLSEVAEE